jgi:hypothetical protein
MGYAYSTYAVDLDVLRKTFGGGDEELYRKLKAKYAKEMIENDEWFDHYLAKGAPPLVVALRELIAGKPARKKHGFQYAYALEMLCKHFGGRIDEADLTWFDEALDPLLKKAKQPSTGKVIGRGVYAVRIPKPADFPEMGTLDAKGQAALGKVLDAVGEPEDEDVKYVTDELRSWLKKAKAKKAGIVWFVY